MTKSSIKNRITVSFSHAIEIRHHNAHLSTFTFQKCEDLHRYFISLQNELLRNLRWVLNDEELYYCTTLFIKASLKDKRVSLQEVT